MSRKPTSKDTPFYEPPENKRTSAQIIQDAKESLQGPKPRPLNTRRPETPLESGRKLFGEQSTRDPKNRPPSTFSLGSRHFDSESRPSSGYRLTPLDHQQQKTRSSEQDGPMAPKPPADPNRPVRRTSSRQKLQQQISVDSQTPSVADNLIRSKSGSLTDVSVSGSGVRPDTTDPQRRVHSGPKERTKHVSSGKAEGQESEQQTRVDSGKRRRSKDRQESDKSSENGSSSEAGREGSAGSQRASGGGKRVGSAGHREDDLFEESIVPIVEEMAKHIKEKNPEKLAELSDRLYTSLHEASLLGKACKHRSGILKTVFKLLDLESPKLLLKLARLIFALKVGGNNLVNVCKLVFKVSREERNDTFFLEDNILDLLIECVHTADLTVSGEALVYCVGSLKFLSSNHTVVKHLVKRHCYNALAKLLVAINKVSSESGKVSEQHGHVLVQLTGTIRNLAEVGGSRSHILSLNLLEELCKVTEVYQGDADLMLNIVRIFSKLTVHQDCCKVVADHPSHFRTFLQLLNKYHKKEDLVVRISYILGNLTSRNDKSRQLLFEQPKALDILLHVFQYYCDQDLKTPANSSKSEGDGKMSNKIEDVLVKVIRVIANLSISQDVGPQLVMSDDCVKLLIQMLERKCLEKNEELVLNTMATINNLSFYNLKSSAITRRQVQLANCLLKYLDYNHMEGTSEATRVYGNLSREREVRDFLIKEKVDEFMVALLDSGTQEVVYTAVGVLINLMADEDRRRVLKIHGGVSKLIDVLRDFGRDDWNLACMVCQTLWNYSGKITSTNATFGEKEGQELADLLDEYLDEETALEGYEPELKDLFHPIWKAEFCPVAIQLLDRIESHQSNFETLDHPS